MSNEIMQENTPFVECSAFHRGMSVLEASLRNTEDSEAIISGLLKGAAEFYGASRECTNYFKCNFHPLHQAVSVYFFGLEAGRPCQFRAALPDVFQLEHTIVAGLCLDDHAVNQIAFAQIQTGHLHT